MTTVRLQEHEGALDLEFNPDQASRPEAQYKEPNSDCLLSSILQGYFYIF